MRKFMIGLTLVTVLGWTSTVYAQKKRVKDRLKIEIRRLKNELL